MKDYEQGFPRLGKDGAYRLVVSPIGDGRARFFAAIFLGSRMITRGNPRRAAGKKSSFDTNMTIFGSAQNCTLAASRFIAGGAATDPLGHFPLDKEHHALRLALELAYHPQELAGYIIGNIPRDPNIDIDGACRRYPARAPTHRLLL